MSLVDGWVTVTSASVNGLISVAPGECGSITTDCTVRVLRSCITVDVMAISAASAGDPDVVGLPTSS
jgi:hypothetical protein